MKSNQISHNLSRLEKFSFKITELMGSRASLVFHTVIIVGALTLRYLAGINNLTLLTVATIVSLEALYLAIFTQIKVNRNTRNLVEAEGNIEFIHEEEKQAHKLMMQTLHMTHQMKSIQHELDLLKKKALIKQTPVSRRAQA